MITDPTPIYEAAAEAFWKRRSNADLGPDWADIEPIQKHAVMEHVAPVVLAAIRATETTVIERVVRELLQLADAANYGMEGGALFEAAESIKKLGR